VAAVVGQLQRRRRGRTRRGSSGGGSSSGGRSKGKGKRAGQGRGTRIIGWSEVVDTTWTWTAAEYVRGGATCAGRTRWNDESNYYAGLLDQDEGEGGEDKEC